MRTSQFIRARVIWETRNAPVVPILAVTRVGDQFFAFIAEPQGNGSFVAHQRPLKLGQMIGNNYVVVDGMKPGEKVVVSGTQFLMDGAPVMPQEVPNS
jgi:multidrug efflux pump subunit AcrA (membrane-fusion protein)